MNLFRRRSVREIKSEMNRIKTEIDAIYTAPFMTKKNFDRWSDLNHKLFEIKSQLK